MLLIKMNMNLNEIITKNGSTSNDKDRRFIKFFFLIGPIRRQCLTTL